MPEPLDPTKYHILTPQQKRNLAIIAAVMLLVITPLLGNVYYNFAVNRPAQNTKETTYEIKEGQSVTQIADELYRNNLVNSAFLFRLYVFLNKDDKNVQAGVYTIPAGLSVVKLMELLGHGTNDIRLTIPEGWRVEEIARELTKKFKNISYETFVNLAGSYEGYLFPDTYYFNSNATEEQVLEVLSTTFKNKTETLFSKENLAKVNLSVEEILKFASILEREVSGLEDRPIVAGILIKRYKSGQLLGADATTQYAVAPIKMGCDPQSPKICPNDGLAMEVNWWPQELTVTDLAYDNAYNTRKNVGLPPTPISNPGLETIEAVLNYKTSPFNYYLTDKNGVMHYASTLDQHIDNISRFL